jgi:hypothetical protein
VAYQLRRGASRLLFPTTPVSCRSGGGSACGPRGSARILGRHVLRERPRRAASCRLPPPQPAAVRSLLPRQVATRRWPLSPEHALSGAGLSPAGPLRPGSVPSSLFTTRIEAGSPLRTPHASGGSELAAADPSGKGGTAVDGPLMCGDSGSRGCSRDRGSVRPGPGGGGAPSKEVRPPGSELTMVDNVVKAGLVAGIVTPPSLVRCSWSSPVSSSVPPQQAPPPSRYR